MIFTAHGNQPRQEQYCRSTQRHVDQKRKLRLPIYLAGTAGTLAPNQPVHCAGGPVVSARNINVPAP
jgi:hypothetical protein